MAVMPGAYLWTGARPANHQAVRCFEQGFDHMGSGRMITRVSSVGIRAGDQGRAVDFYVGKRGFGKRRDERRDARVGATWSRAGRRRRGCSFCGGTMGLEKRRGEPMGADGRWVEVAPP